MKKKKLSIIDIARQLNVSATTVSFILNGKSKEKRISQEMTEKVMKHVEEIGYKPNLLARSFRTGKSNIIGLMVENISNSFFSNLARMIEENAYEQGYKILYCSTENDTSKARELLQMFQAHHVDGYIITPTEGLEEDINMLVKSGAQVILFDRKFENDLYDYVVLDNLQSTYNATKHLIRQGYDEIAFITINSLQSQMQQRLQGYEKAIDEAGLTHYVKELDYNMSAEDKTAHIRDFLKRKPRINAVLFATNYNCISGLQAIKQLNLSVPKDIAVVSFDDHILFELYSPSITAIAQPIETMSSQLINVLLDKLASENLINHKVVLAGSLIVRESSAKRTKK
ncbi:MAG: substrate-binding domain-containing protein [Ferruginibacter sp.]